MTGFKLVALFLGILMSLVNISLDYDTFNFLDSNLTYNVSDAKIAGSALIAAMFVLVSILSNPNAPFLDRFIQAMGAVAAGAAAWFALEKAMGGKPWLYFALTGIYVCVIATASYSGAHSQPLARG